MKAVAILAGLFLTATTAVCQDLGPIISLPQCPKSCVFDTIGKAPSYGCGPQDIRCLCKSKGYQAEMVKCAQKCSAEERGALESAGRKLCADAGAPLPPSAGDITLTIPAPQIPTPNLPPLPEIPSPSIPSIPTPNLPPLPEIPSPSIPNIPFPSIPNIPMPSIPGIPNIPMPSIPGIPPLPGISFPPIPLPSLQIETSSVPSGSATILPIFPSSSVGSTSLHPIMTSSSSMASAMPFPTSSVISDPFLGAGNMLAPVHAQAVAFGILALVL
ncbi:hypothetical protein FQN53_008879 [Emmonsiellopsis sp. PD_33]|nr:hypothetical protein FQN53_008879 [Emmonsiellopsis sp. PD_33]